MAKNEFMDTTMNGKGYSQEDAEEKEKIDKRILAEMEERIQMLSFIRCSRGNVVRDTLITDKLSEAARVEEIALRRIQLSFIILYDVVKQSINNLGRKVTDNTAIVEFKTSYKAMFQIYQIYDQNNTNTVAADRYWTWIERYEKLFLNYMALTGKYEEIEEYCKDLAVETNMECARAFLLA